MYLLILPGELDRLQQALCHSTGADVADKPTLAQLRRTVQIKLTQASTQTGCTRPEIRRLTGWSRQTVQQRLAPLKLLPLARLGVVPLPLVYQIALPYLTMAAHASPISAQCSARLVTLTETEIYVTALVLAEAVQLQTEPVLAHLAEWFDLLSQTQVSLPLRAVVPYWAEKIYRQKSALRQKYLDLTRRSLFYRTKLVPGVLHLVEADAGQRHLDTCHLWRSEVVALGRNTWAVGRTEAEVTSPPVLTRLWPGGEA